MKCPVCGAVYRPVRVGEDEEVVSISPQSLACRRCKADLSDLIRLHDQAIWYHRQALFLFSQGYYSEAAAQNNNAIALYYSNADFHALAGQLRALQGEFKEAVLSWQQALKFDQKHSFACNCLQMIELMAEKF